MEFLNFFCYIKQKWPKSTVLVHVVLPWKGIHLFVPLQWVDSKWLSTRLWPPLIVATFHTVCNALSLAQRRPWKGLVVEFAFQAKCSLLSSAYAPQHVLQNKLENGEVFHGCQVPCFSQVSPSSTHVHRLILKKKLGRKNVLYIMLTTCLVLFKDRSFI